MWEFTATSNVAEPDNWTISWSAGGSSFLTGSRDGEVRSISGRLQTAMFTIFAGRTWSVSIDGGTDSNGGPVGATQTFDTDGTWTGTAGVGQCRTLPRRVALLTPAACGGTAGEPRGADSAPLPILQLL